MSKDEVRGASPQPSSNEPSASVAGPRSDGLGTALLLGLLIIGVNFFFDGCGASRVSSYFSQYHGSAGYSHLAIAGRVQLITDPPKSLWRNLYYGSKLRGQKAVTLNISQSEVPPQDIEIILASDKFVSQIKPGQAFCFHVSHVGNYYTFLLRERHGFEVYSVHPLNETEAPLVAKPGWALPYKWYSACVLLLPIFFIIAAMRILQGGDSSRSRSERLGALLRAIPFILLYAGAAFYVAKLDWVDQIWPTGKVFWLLILVGGGLWIGIKQPD